MRFFQRWTALFVYLLVFTACGPSEQDEVTSPTPSVEAYPGAAVSQTLPQPAYPGGEEGSPLSNQAYPGPEESQPLFEEGYPAPTVPVEPTEDIPFVLPEPGDDTGTVRGQMVLAGQDNEPYPATLYLGDTIYASNQEESEPLISFSEADSLAGVQNRQTGEFYFADVPPGEYALIIWTPVFSMVVDDLETEQTLLFTVGAGEVTDLGIIKIR